MSRDGGSRAKSVRFSTSLAVLRWLFCAAMCRSVKPFASRACGSTPRENSASSSFARPCLERENASTRSSPPPDAYVRAVRGARGVEDRTASPGALFSNRGEDSVFVRVTEFGGGADASLFLVAGSSTSRGGGLSAPRDRDPEACANRETAPTGSRALGVKRRSRRVAPARARSSSDSDKDTASATCPSFGSGAGGSDATGTNAVAASAPARGFTPDPPPVW
mmetsp:Transcript_9409/g.39518  ORF Transcript_9409/g.39518 Transcript_9409/m.39518 type:complete len:222 (+) Transcript_9409:479-1144(+)